MLRIQYRFVPPRRSILGLMKQQAILDHAPIVLTQAQRHDYFDQGYLKLDGYVQDAELENIQRGLRELVQASATRTESSPHFELADDHSTKHPHPVVMKMVADLSPVIWDYVSGTHLTNLAVDLLGPDVKFRESYINYKKAEVGRNVSWHQDFPFFRPPTGR